MEKNFFVQTAELLFIITGDMNISTYGVPIVGYNSNGIGSPFNQLFKSESGVDIDYTGRCAFPFAIKFDMTQTIKVGKPYHNGIILGTAKKAF